MEEDGIGVLGGEEERLLPCLCIMGKQDKEVFENENENEFVCLKFQDMASLKISGFRFGSKFKGIVWFRVSLGIKEIFHMAGRARFFS